MNKFILVAGVLFVSGQLYAQNLNIYKNKDGELILSNKQNSDLGEYQSKVEVKYYADTTEEDAKIAKREAEMKALVKKPGAKIGMTSSQVKKNTNWGEPERVNETLDSSGSFQQWVYGDEYLYFKNGKLVSIHTSR